jgi:hypothetical protein
MGGQPEWETTAYTHDLRRDRDVLRVRLRVVHGEDVRFTVQYEAVVEGETYPVVRYDNAHGAAHRDTLNLAGGLIAKDWIENKPNAAVVTEAISDIKANWPAYRDKFLRRTR